MTEPTTQNIPVGRPTDYISIYPEILLEQARNGKSVTQFCALIGIGRNTFYEWLKRFPEFQDAYTRARPMINAYWMDKAENLIIESGDKESFQKTNHNVLKMLWSAHALSSDDRAIIIPGFAEAQNDVDKRNCVLNALAAGEITAGEADKFLVVLERGMKIQEASEIAQRVAKLEELNGIQNAA